METPRPQRTAQEINEDAVEQRMDQDSKRAEALMKVNEIIEAG